MNSKERLFKLLESLQIGQAAFEKKAGISNGYINNLKNSIGANIASKISVAFPNVNINWLLTGEGEMLKDSEYYIQKAILYLENTSKVHTEISLYSEISSTTILDYMEKVKEPTYKDAYKLVNYFERIGEELPEEKLDVKFYEPDQNIPQGRKLIPIYDDVSTIGGKLEKGYSANMKSSYSAPTEWIDPGDWFKGVTAAIRHYEHSMIEYPSGCILALKEVQEWRLLIPGRNYVIETTEYRVTKKLQSVHVNEFIGVRSTNEEKYEDGELVHPPFNIQWDLIGRIFEVLGYVVKTGSGTMVYTNQNNIL